MGKGTEQEDLIERIAKLPPEQREIVLQRLNRKGHSHSPVGIENASQPAASPEASQLREATESSTLTYPLSFGQQALWFIYRLDPSTSIYNLLTAFLIRGPLDVGALERTLRMLVDRHAQLRAIFEDHGSEPMQKIERQHALNLEVVDASDWSAENIEEYARRQQRLSFDLENGPVYRFKVLRCAEHEHRLLFVFHHIVFDGASAAIIAADLLDTYSTAISGEGLPPRAADTGYKDFVLWQRRLIADQAGERQRGYWKEQLAGDLPVLDLPTDRPRDSVQRHQGGSVTFTLGSQSTGALRNLAKQAGTRLHTVVLAALQVLLHRYTGQKDILVGVPALGRTSVELASTVGYFVNPVVFRANLSGNPSFVELLDQVHQTSIAALSNQDYPFSLLVQQLHPHRDLARNPIFQVMMDWERMRGVTVDGEAHPARPVASAQVGPLQFEPILFPQQEGILDLALDIKEIGESLYCILKYDAALFHEATIARMASQFRTLLDDIIANPDRPIGRLALLSEEERRQILVDWNRTDAPYPQENCVHALIEAQVERTPSAIAVVSEHERLTYGELNTRTNGLAHRLAALGVRPGDFVGLCVERSVEMVVGLLGILKAGAAYVPLDPGYPTERLQYMIKNAQISLLLTQRGQADRIEPFATQAVYLDDIAWTEIEHARTPNPGVAMSSDELAYVIYTSGSTGQPKGVAVAHRSLVNFLWHMKAKLSPNEGDVLLAVTSLSFDPAGLELHLPLLAGARIVIATSGEVRDGHALLHRLHTSGATFMHGTPVSWRMLLEVGWDGSKGLNVLCGGEPLSRDLAQELVTRSASVWNLYGPTETTVCSTLESIVLGDGAVTIGRPIANTRAYVLDENLEPVPIGVAGELYLAGDGVARGYWRLPELTAERFVAEPFAADRKARMYRTGDMVRYRADGRLEVLGRTDFQVKVRGFRIELGEVETAIARHPSVRQAVVAARTDTTGTQKLVAYGIPEAGNQLSWGELRDHLKTSLPEYMVPTNLVWLNEFPLTPNGKIDRLALPDPALATDKTPENLAAPSGPIEIALARIWEDLLEIDEISAYDTFFDLGGHSLLTLKVVDRVEKEMGIRINPGDLVSQTLRQLASAMETQIEPATTASAEQPNTGLLSSPRTVFQRAPER